MTVEKKEESERAATGSEAQADFPDTVFEDWTATETRRLDSRRAEVAAVDKLLRAEESLLIEQRSRLNEMTRTADQLQNRIHVRARELEKLRQHRMELKARLRSMHAEVEQLAAQAGTNARVGAALFAAPRSIFSFVTRHPGSAALILMLLAGLAVTYSAAWLPGTLQTQLRQLTQSAPALSPAPAPEPKPQVAVPALYDETRAATDDFAGGMKLAPQLDRVVPAAASAVAAKEKTDKPLE
ncbi:MAG: hypothetical protein EPO06_03645 [Burkholderiaceae bacterium]|nr:MAG: hypothetical protein EPO06_03645 [Burkholderiaceae bacterium]